MAQTSGWGTLDSRQGDKAVKPVEETPQSAVKAVVEQTGGGTQGYDQKAGVAAVDCATWQEIDQGGLASVQLGDPEYGNGEIAGPYEAGLAAGENNASGGLEG